MIFIDLVHLTIAVFVALFILRYVQTKISSESTTGKAFAFVLH